MEPDAPARDRPDGRLARAAGLTTLVVAVVLFASGLAIFLAGNEVAILLIIVAFAVFVLGVGFWMAGTRRR